MKRVAVGKEWTAKAKGVALWHRVGAGLRSRGCVGVATLAMGVGIATGAKLKTKSALLRLVPTATLPREGTSSHSSGPAAAATHDEEGEGANQGRREDDRERRPHPVVGAARDVANHLADARVVRRA